MPVTQVTSHAQFKKAINSNRVAVVDFYATWCRPCKVVAPEFERMSARYPRALFLKVDVDDQTEVSRDCGVRAMPTFRVYHQGSQLAEVVGGNMSELEGHIKTHMAKSTGTGAFPGTGYRLGGENDDDKGRGSARQSAGSVVGDTKSGSPKSERQGFHIGGIQVEWRTAAFVVLFIAAYVYLNFFK